MTKPTSNSTKERVRLAQKKAKRPENLKEQGEAGNRTQNIQPATPPAGPVVMTKKHPNTDRSHGGPGSSDQDERGVNMIHKSNAAPGQNKIGGARNPHHSAISGGGGELDAHHTHEPSVNKRRKQA